jgi:hypothetical protein
LKFLVAVPVSEKSVVADVHESTRENVKKEPSQKLHSIQSHRAMTATLVVVLPVECNLAVFTTNEPLIGNGNAMGVSSEVLEYVFGASERGFGVNDPIFFS